MMALRAVWFLFGTTIVSCHVLRNGMPCLDTHGLGPPKIPSYALPFIQQGTNLFYKPQFISPGTVIHSPISETSALTPIEVIGQKPMEIPQPPELPPVVIPEQPDFLHEGHSGEPLYTVPDFDVTFKPMEIPEPPELPSLPEPIAPIIIEVNPSEISDGNENSQGEAFAIPEAPILPPFSMPELPSVIPVIPTEAEIQPAPEQKPSEIPEAPVLSPTTPEFGEVFPAPGFKPINIPEAPTLLPLILHELPEIETERDNPHAISECENEAAPETNPIEIPEAPVIPSLRPELIGIFPIAPETKPIPEAPMLPPIILNERPEIEGDGTHTQVIPDCDDNPDLEIRPIEIPEAPVLPPFTMPELPDFIIPIAPEIPEVVQIQPAPEHKPIEIPETPVLLPLTPEFNYVFPIAPETKPIQIPEAPTLSPILSPEFSEVLVNNIPDFDDQPTPESKPIHIPAPPTLPESVIPDCDEQTANEPKYVEISEAPVLPPFTMPEIPNLILRVPSEIHDVGEFHPASEFKHIEIPEAPVLPPLAIPEIPSFMPIAPEIPETIEAQPIPKANLIEIPEALKLPPFKPDVEIEINNDISESTPDCEDQPAFGSQLLHIPEAPTLPSMAEIQKPVEIIRPDDDCTPADNVESEKEPEIKLLELPVPPELPLFEFPSISAIDEEPEPKSIIIPEAPKLPAIATPMPISPEVFEYQPMLTIPEAPQLPPYSMPRIPTLIIEEPAPVAVEPVQPIEEQPQPLKEIPPAPVLPAFDVPAIAVPAEESDFAPAKPAAIPAAPQVPRLTIPAMQPIVVAESKDEPCHDNHQPSLESFVPPTFWAQNIIIERVMPNLVISNKEYAKSLELGTKYPVNTRPYFVEYAH